MSDLEGSIFQDLKPWPINNSRTFYIRCTEEAPFVGNSPPEDLVPADIRGDSFVFSVKRYIDDADDAVVLQHQFDAPFVGEDLQEEFGRTEMIVPSSVISAAVTEPGMYVYDLIWVKKVSQPGDAVTLRQGKVPFVIPVLRDLSGV